MTEIDRELSTVLEVLLEWGPEMRRPVPDRVHERLPHLTPERAQALITEAQKIQSAGYDLAGRSYHGEIPYDVGLAQLNERYPNIDPSTLTHVWNQGGYYAWHG